MNNTKKQYYPAAPFHDDAANDNRTLTDSHRNHLHASGLTDETIDELGFYSDSDAENRELLRWPAKMDANAAGLVIPYPNVPGYAKVRPDQPRRDVPKGKCTCPHSHGLTPLCEYCTSFKAARVIKYEAPMGSKPVPYIPLSLNPAIADHNERLYLTEGEKKAALMNQEGLPTIGVPGVSSLHDTEARRQARDWGGDEFQLPKDYSDYISRGREVCIAYDSPDMETNPDVIRGAVRGARMIKKRGAIPLVTYIPHEANGEKRGVDDYLYPLHEPRLAAR